MWSLNCLNPVEEKDCARLDDGICVTCISGSRGGCDRRERTIRNERREPLFLPALLNLLRIGRDWKSAPLTGADRAQNRSDLLRQGR